MRACTFVGDGPSQARVLLQREEGRIAGDESYGSARWIDRHAGYFDRMKRFEGSSQHIHLGESAGPADCVTLNHHQLALRAPAEDLLRFPELASGTVGMPGATTL